MLQPSMSVSVVMPTGARAEISSIEVETLTIHPSGALGAPSLHFGSLGEARAWYADLGERLAVEEQRRIDARRALDDARRSLDRVGAVSTLRRVR